MPIYTLFPDAKVPIFLVSIRSAPEPHFSLALLPVTSTCGAVLLGVTTPSLSPLKVVINTLLKAFFADCVKSIVIVLPAAFDVRYVPSPTTFNVWLCKSTSAPAVAVVLPAIFKFVAFSCATFTASVSFVPAAKFVICRSLPLAPIETDPKPDREAASPGTAVAYLFTRPAAGSHPFVPAAAPATDSEPSATEPAAVAVAPEPKARVFAPAAVAPLPKAAPSVVCTLAPCPIAVA